MSDLSMLIGGAFVAVRNGATFERRNPLDGSVATRAAAATPEDAVAAVEAAASAFGAWSRTGPGERRALLLKAPMRSRRARRNSSKRLPPRRAPAPCGPASTCTWPPACCARRPR